MFLFANLLLLALLAAVPVGFAVALRREGSPHAAFTALWRQEDYLFGRWCANQRARAGVWLLTAGLTAYEVSVCFCNSMARENWPWVQGVLAPVLDWVAFLCFGVKILFCTRYSWRSLGAAGCLYFIARWVYFNSHNIWFIGIAVAVLAAKDVALDKPLRAYLCGGFAAIATVMVLHFAGIVAPDLVSERVGELRPTFGYGHPNTLGGLVLGIALAYAMLRADKPRVIDAAVVAGIGVFLLVGPASRSAGLCCLLLGVLLLSCRLFAAKSEPQKKPNAKQNTKTALLPRLALPAAGTVPALAAVSYLLPLLLVKIGTWNTDFGPAWLAKLDQLLTCRISLSWFAYRLIPLKIAGQILPDWPPLDNSFVFSLFQFGPVLTLLLCLLYCAALYGFARQNRRVELCCLLAMLVYAYMECQSFHLTTNPTALLLCGAVFALPAAHWPRLHDTDDTHNAAEK